MAASIPIEHVVFLAAILFALGLLGVLVRRNLIFILVSLEIMLNATGLVFVAAGAHWAQADGQILYMLIISLAAAEAAVGLAIMLQLYYRHQTLDAEAASEMRG